MVRNSLTSGDVVIEKRPNLRMNVAIAQQMCNGRNNTCEHLNKMVNTASTD